LNSVQAGRSAKDWKPMPLVGPGVIEIRVHMEGEYLVFDLAKFEEAVYVLHAFVKKTRKTSSLDIGQEALSRIAGKADVMRVTKGNENVFVDCGFPSAEAENLRMRSEMMIALSSYIEDRKISQTRAAKIMGVSQPRVSHLMRGKIGSFTLDALVNMLTATGLKVDISIKPGRPRGKKVA
jgi:predicted XRE-type DNA-binding protein